MALNPRMVIADVDVAWDGGITRVLAGTVIDVPDGHPLEAAYGGTDNLQSLDDQVAANLAAGAGGVTV
ncbi:MAG TPA: hypothetical protein VEV45_20990 [Streptosporangiaceae bacterium]|nr:hypothetical protein [Streptosporangiaceae bacterium]